MVIPIYYDRIWNIGTSKLPEIGRASGHTLAEFKGVTKGLVSDEERKGKNLVNDF